MIKQLIARFDKLAENSVSDKSQVRKAIILMRGSLLTGLFMVNYVGVSLLIDFKTGVAIMPYEAFLFFCLPVLFYYKVNLKIIGHLYILIGWAFGIGLVVFSGGFYSPVMPWLTLMPINAILFIGRREAWIWAFILLGTLLIMAGYWHFVGEFPRDYDTSTNLFYYTNCYCGLIFIYLLLSLIFEQRLTKAYEEVENQNIALAVEKKKSDDLLLNILPSEIAEELKTNGFSKAQSFDHVTVLFSDFVNFTGISQLMSPTELVEEIHKNFTVFDAIMEKHGIEKIKTIGDAYMAVCGLPHENNEHA